MSTFLSLCQDLCRECDIASGEDAISAVANQSGELQRIVKWVANSYTELQNRHQGQWRWLRHGFTVDTTEDDDTYAYGDVTDTTTSAAITRFSRWYLEDCEDPPKIYLTSSGVGTQNWLIYTPWEWFKTIYRIGSQNSGYPAHITVDPQNNLVIGPKPNGVYTITGDYYRSAQVLAADDDEPEMPPQFHQLIVYMAMAKYGGFESAQEVIYRAQNEGGPLLRQLEANQLPPMRLAGPLA